MRDRRGAYKALAGGHLEDPGLDGRIILKWIFEKWNGSMDWNDLPEDRDRRRAVLSAVVNLWVS